MGALAKSWFAALPDARRETLAAVRPTVDLDLTDIDNNGILVYRNRGTVVTPVADLKTTVTSPSTVKANVVLAQPLAVTNQGTVRMSGAGRIAVPSLLKVQSWSDPACTLSGQSLTCPVPALSGGGRYGVSVSVKGTKTGSGTTSATLMSTSTPDGDPGDNASSAAVTIVRK